MFKKIIIIFILIFPIFAIADSNGNSQQLNQTQRSIVSSPTTIIDQKNAYEIKLSFPLITGDKSQSSLEFNAAINAVINNIVDAFKKNLPTPDQVNDFRTKLNIKDNSELIVETDVIFNQNGILSLRMKNFVYILGQAHPLTTFQSFTYDLNQGKTIQLSDLFRSDANYLQTIAKYCFDELTKKNISNQNWISEGTEPIAKNYNNWNITDKGIQITFDTYQVADYVAGPQTIVVPYSVLANELRPNSPISFLVNPEW